jgi:hypothetical protein
MPREEPQNYEVKTWRKTPAALIHSSSARKYWVFSTLMFYLFPIPDCIAILCGNYTVFSHTVSYN